MDRANKIIEMNKTGKIPESLSDSGINNNNKFDYEDIVGQESITRFDKKRKKKRKKRRREKKQNIQNNQNRQNKQ